MKEIFHDSGVFQVDESYWPSTLEQFLSHSSGAPGLGVVVSQYYDMIDFIFNKVGHRKEKEFDLLDGASLLRRAGRPSTTTERTGCTWPAPCCRTPSPCRRDTSCTPLGASP